MSRRHVDTYVCTAGLEVDLPARAGRSGGLRGQRDCGVQPAWRRLPLLRPHAGQGLRPPPQAPRLRRVPALPGRAGHGQRRPERRPGRLPPARQRPARAAVAASVAGSGPGPGAGPAAKVQGVVVGPRRRRRCDGLRDQELALECAGTIAPVGTLAEVYDGLELGVLCNATRPAERSTAAAIGTHALTGREDEIVVDPVRGDDRGGAGIIASPVRTIPAALRLARRHRAARGIAAAAAAAAAASASCSTTIADGETGDGETGRPRAQDWHRHPLPGRDDGAAVERQRDLHPRRCGREAGGLGRGRARRARVEAAAGDDGGVRHRAAGRHGLLRPAVRRPPPRDPGALPERRPRNHGSTHGAHGLRQGQRL